MFDCEFCFPCITAGGKGDDRCVDVDTARTSVADVFQCISQLHNTTMWRENKRKHFIGLRALWRWQIHGLNRRSGQVYRWNEYVGAREQALQLRVLDYL